MEFINPEGWPRPKGYSNGVLAPAGGRLLSVAGCVAWDEEEKVVSDVFSEQFGKALSNVVEVCKAAGGSDDVLAVELFSKQFVADVVATSARAQEQVAQLDELWPDVIRALVQDTVNNLHRGDEWMSTLDQN